MQVDARVAPGERAPSTTSTQHRLVMHVVRFQGMMSPSRGGEIANHQSRRPGSRVLVAHHTKLWVYSGLPGCAPPDALQARGRHAIAWQHTTALRRRARISHGWPISALPLTPAHPPAILSLLCANRAHWRVAPHVAPVAPPLAVTAVETAVGAAQCLSFCLSCELILHA